MRGSERKPAPNCFACLKRIGKFTVLLLFFVPSCWAQISNVSDVTSAPVPGVGHDYIKFLAETVSPATGSVSVRIEAPQPKVRGALDYPFHIFTYDSNGVHLPTIIGAPDPAKWTTTFLAGDLLQWFATQGTGSLPLTATSVPAGGYDTYKNNTVISPSNPNNYCSYTYDYMYTDPSGARHPLTLLSIYAQAGTGTCVSLGIPWVQNGGDNLYQAYIGSLTGNGGNCQGCFTPNITNAHGVAMDKEDGNGNLGARFATITPETSPYTPSDWGLNPNGSGTQLPQNVIASTAVYGTSSPYRFTYALASSNFTLTSNLVAGSNGAPNCSSSLSSVNETQLVVTAITLPNGQSYQFQYDPVYGLLSKIIYPTGAWVSYTWTPISQSQGVTWDVSGANGWVCGYQYAWPQVTKRVVSFDGTTQALEQDFSYTTTWGSPSGGVVFWNQKTTTVTTKDLLRSGQPSFQTTYSYVPFSAQPQPGEDSLGAETAQISVESSIVYKDWNGAVLKTVTKKWLNRDQLGAECVTLPNGLTSGDFYTYQGFAYAPLNVMTHKREYDYGLVSSTCALPSTTPTRETISAYQSFPNTPLYSGGPSINDRPSSVQVNDNGTLLAETDYAYDQTAASSVSPTPVLHDETNYSASYNNRGNLTTKTVKCFQSGCSNAITTYAHDETGQVLSTVDPNGHTTYLSYADNFASGDTYTAGLSAPGNTNTYLTQITYPPTNSVSHIEKFSYDYPSGQLTASTDQNGQVTEYRYDDAFARPTQSSYPDLGQTVISYNDSVPSVTTSKKLNTLGQHVTTMTVMDGMGHVTDSELTSAPCGTVYTATTYDGLGQPYTVTNPYCSTSDPTYGLTTYTYDALGRTTQIKHPDGTVISTAYTGRATELTDEGNGTKSVQRISQTDALGRLTSVCEVSGATQFGTTPTPAACGQDISATGFLTSYSYNALGNATGVTQGGLNSRTFAYDSLSRLTSATNPESGQTNYAYDANSNVLTKTDARSVTTTYTYDAMNRLLSKTYSDGTTPGANFTYDASSEWGVTLTNPIGRLVLESTDNNHAMAIFSYDPMGRTANEWQCTPLNCGSGAFSLPYTYDLAGDNLTSSNGEGVTFTSTYDTAAQLTSMTSSLSDANHPGTLLSNGVYNAPGQLTSGQLGNGITETRAYNPRLWMTSLSAGSAYNLNMTSYAPNGDILAANDSANGSWTYTYDDFNRLATANATGQAYTYKYDRFGNRWQQNGPHTMLLTFSANNNRMDGYSYDAAGDVLNDGVHTYTYDAENRIVTVDGSATTYVYDADGRRVRKTVGGASTDYVYDLAGHSIAEVNASGWQRGEVYADGRHLATYANSTTYFDHGDWLGTERVRTAVNGSVCESITSLPFGDGQSTTGSCADVSTRHFTGKERDPESNLDDFGARYNSSSMGRFMSPDWAAKPTSVPYAEFGDPQSLNLYSYVRNNPLSRPDIDGHDYICWLCLAEAAKHFFSTRQGQEITKGAGMVGAGALTVVAASQPEVSGPVFALGALSGVSTGETGLARIYGAMTGHDTTRTQKTLGALGTPAGIITTAATKGNVDAGAAVSSIEDLVTAVATPKDLGTAAGMANLPFTLGEAGDLAKDAGQMLANIIPPPPVAPPPPPPCRGNENPTACSD